MNQIANYDWLPERARRSYVARLGLPAAPPNKNFPESLITNPDQSLSLFGLLYPAIKISLKAL